MNSATLWANITVENAYTHMFQRTKTALRTRLLTHTIHTKRTLTHNGKSYEELQDSSN